MTDNLHDRVITFLAATGLIFIVGALLLISIALLLVAGDTLRHYTGLALDKAAAIKHRRTARREAARTDLDAALAELTKENNQ
jgi:hypothetical protein